MATGQTRFSQPLGNGLMSDPMTGDVLDIYTGEVIPLDSQLSAAAEYSSQAPSQPQSAPMSGVDPMTAGGGAGALGLGALLSSGTASTAAGVAPSAPVVVSAQGIAPTGLGYASEAAATAGMGIEALPGAGLAPYAAPVVAAGVGAHLGKDSYTAGEGKSPIKGMLGGLKEPSGAEWFTLGPLTPAVGALGGLAGSMFGSGKSKEQRGRDQGRDKFRGNTSIYNPEIESQIKTAGGFFDTRDNGGKSYNVDWKDKRSSESVGAFNPLVNAVMSMGDRSAHAGLVAELANASQKGPGDWQKNIEEIYKNSGLTRDQIYQAAADAWTNKQINAGERDAWFAETDKRFGVKNTSGGRWDQQVGLSESDQKRNQSELTGTNLKKKK